LAEPSVSTLRYYWILSMEQRHCLIGLLSRRTEPTRIEVLEEPSSPLFSNHHYGEYLVVGRGE
jgi:hypothetical protein